MQDYCEEQKSCRRRSFSSKFGEMECSAAEGMVSRHFTSCGNMCDNCLSKAGAAGKVATPEEHVSVSKKRARRDDVCDDGKNGVRKKIGASNTKFQSARLLMAEGKENDTKKIPAFKMKAASGVISIVDGEDDNWRTIDRGPRHK
jgi:hypothetical protein